MFTGVSNGRKITLQIHCLRLSCMGQIRAHHARQPRHGGRESAKRSWVCIRLCLNARGRESAHTSARLAPQRSLFIGTHAPLPTQRADPAASGRARCIQRRVSIPGSAWERSRRARGRIASTTRLDGHMALRQSPDFSRLHRTHAAHSAHIRPRATPPGAHLARAAGTRPPDAHHVPPPPPWSPDGRDGAAISRKRDWTVERDRGLDLLEKKKWHNSEKHRVD